MISQLIAERLRRNARRRLGEGAGNEIGIVSCRIGTYEQIILHPVSVHVSITKVRRSAESGFSDGPFPIGRFPMTDELKKLLDVAKNVKLSPEQSEEQRRSFAFGNTNIENPRITRETIDKEAEKLKHK